MRTFSLLTGSALLLAAAMAVRAAVDPGEVLLGELNCVACHEVSPAVRARLASREAPRLGAEGVRIRPRHLRAFLENPAAAKPGTLMPDALHGLEPGEKAAVAEALTHYLVSLAGPASVASAHEVAGAEEVAAGKALYHEAGCVQCHAPRELPRGVEVTEEVRAEFERLQQVSVPLGPLAAKYSAGELARFLRDPLKTRPAGRMPSLRLTEAEAGAVAAWLLEDAAQAAGGGAVPDEGAFAVDAAKAAQGAGFYVSMQCGRCHGALPGAGATTVPPPAARPLAQLRARQPAGCVGTRPGGPAVKFELSDRQRVVLLATLQNQAVLEEPLEPREAVRRTMTVLNCFACHVRDRRGGVSGLRREYLGTLGGRDLGDEGRVPPPLNGIGAKLRPEWLRASLVEGAVARPYMATRMPLFGAANVAHLPALLAQADVRPEAAPEPAAPPASPALREAGRQLVGAGGFHCTACHDLGGGKSSGEPGIDLATSARRLTWDWFRRYLLDPAAVRPGTRMPAFWPEGKSPRADVLGGDAEAQVRAIWEALRAGDSAGPLR